MRVLYAVLAVAVLVALPWCAWSQTVVYADKSKASTTAIDDAITSLGSAGGTVLITQGTWNGPASAISTGITLRGTGAQPEDIIIKGGGSGAATIEVSGTGVTLEGLSVTNGKHGVQVDSSGDVTINRCSLRENVTSGSDDDGNGVLVNGAAMLVNCSIADNNGDGVRINGTGSAKVYFCSILRNAYCGVFADGGGMGIVKYSLITRNGDGELKDITDPNYNFLFSSSSDLPAAPVWTLEPEWAGGAPTGGGGSATTPAATPGNPDPTADATHPYVLGVNLAGNYSPPSAAAQSVASASVTSIAGEDTRIAISVPSENSPLLIGNLDVALTLAHTNLSALQVSLEFDNGRGTKTTIPLFSSAPSGAITSRTIHFNDQAAKLLNDPTNAIADVTDGASFRPGSPFAALNGLDAAYPGNKWSIIVKSSGGTGGVSQWTLSVSPLSTSTTTLTASSSLPATIPAAGDVPLNLSGSGTSPFNASDFLATVGLTFTNIEELAVDLQYSDGTTTRTATLFEVGDFPATGAITALRFSDQGTQPLKGTLAADVGSVGAFLPVTPLATLAGKDVYASLSSWKLIVRHPGGSGTGTVTAGSVDVTGLLGGTPKTLTSASVDLRKTLRIPLSAPALDVADLHVRLASGYTNLNELGMSLEAPNGATTVELFSPGDLTVTSLNVVLSDYALSSITTAAADAAGEFVPKGYLSDFNGHQPAGTWTLIVSLPDVPTGAGNIDSWGLDVVPLTTATLSRMKDDSGDLDFSLYSAVALKFQRWLNMDDWSTAVVQASNDGGTTWTTVWDKGQRQRFDSDWTEQRINISDVAAGQAHVRVRWGYIAEGGAAQPCSGWNIDDITFMGASGAISRAKGGLYVQSGSILPTFNLVKFNTDDKNYTNVTQEPDPDTNPSTIDCSTAIEAITTSFEQIRLAPDATWAGQLEAVSPPKTSSTLLDRVPCDKALALWQGLTLDYDGDLRAAPWNTYYDIGADELTASNSNPFWYECHFYPASTYESPYIKQTAVNGLTIVLRIDGFKGYFASYANDKWSDGYQVFLETNSETTDPRGDAVKSLIPLNVTPSGEKNAYTCKNAIAIDRIGKSLIGTDRVYTDGIGLVRIFNPVASADLKPLTGTQADAGTPSILQGRRFLIDTCPPRLEVTGTGMAGDFLKNDSFIADNQKVEWPSDGRGPLAFYNATSTLKVNVEATMRDTVPDEAILGTLPTPVPLKASDTYMSGVPAPATINATSANTNTLLYEGRLTSGTPQMDSPVYWARETGAPAKLNGAVAASFEADVNGRVKVTWSFPSGMDPDSSFDVFGLPIRFVGVDRAGNVTSGDMLLDPVTIWWLRAVHTQLSPGPLNGEFKEPNFRWRLLRHSEPPESSIKPQFRFRLEYLNNLNAFVPVQLNTAALDASGWSAWDTAVELPYSWFEQNGITKKYAGATLRMVVFGRDEAGNEELLPNFALANGGDDNWEVFRIPIAGISIDTSATVKFWDDADEDGTPDATEASYGTATKLCVPDLNGKVSALFSVHVSAKNLTNLGVRWELWRRPKSAAWTKIGDNNDLSLVWLSNDGTAAPIPFRLWENTTTAAARDNLLLNSIPAEYRFVAWGRYDPNVAAGTAGMQDTTPVEVTFSVVDCTKENVTVDSDQPVKVYQKK